MSNFRLASQGAIAACNAKRKTVHAFVAGILQDAIAEVVEPAGIKVSYNPYKAGYFYNASTGEPVYQAKSVTITPYGVFVEE